MKSLRIVFSLLVLICVPLSAHDFKAGDAGVYKIIRAGSEMGRMGYEITKVDDQGVEIKGWMKLSGPNGYQVESTSTTVVAPCGSPKSYYIKLSEAMGGGEPTAREIDVKFDKENAAVKITSAGETTERNIALPEDWVLLDNNSITHWTLLLAGLSQDMEPLEVRMFTPQNMSFINLSAEAIGNAEFEAGGKNIACVAYKLLIASSVDFTVYVADGKTLGAVSDSQAIRFELVPE